MVAMLAVAVLALAAGCGAKGHGAETDSDKASDAEYLNTALAKELTLVDAYGHGLPLLRGRPLAVGRRFQAQEQEYLDAISKALRGLGGKAEAEKEELDFSALGDEASALSLLYEQESDGLRWDSSAASHMLTSAPDTLITALAVGHGQHLVVLRQLLGTNLTAAAPEGFDGGEVPPPPAGDASAAAGGSGGGGG